MEFVLSAFTPMPESLWCYPRLYAFPRQPDPPVAGAFLILDSGAFGLAQRGSQIGARHIRRLASYYQAYTCNPAIICIAPDVCYNPRQTMCNFETHHRQYPAQAIAPVIQMPARRYLDLHQARQQARFYASYVLPQLYGRPFIAIGNPYFRGIEAGKSFIYLCDLIRQAIPNAWIHLLGAGWSVEDIRAWAALQCVDSMDSVAYYEDARRGVTWRAPAGGDWRQLAIQNALAAIAAAKGDNHV